MPRPASPVPSDMLITWAPCWPAYRMPSVDARRRTAGSRCTRPSPGSWSSRMTRTDSTRAAGATPMMPAGPARPAAVPGDERGDERPVQVRRLVPGRVRAQGVVRPGGDRAGQVGRARVHAGVQHGRRSPRGPGSPARPPVASMALQLRPARPPAPGPAAPVRRPSGPAAAGAAPSVRSRPPRRAASRARPGGGHRTGPVSMTTAGRPRSPPPRPGSAGPGSRRASCAGGGERGGLYSPVAAAGRHPRTRPRSAARTARPAGRWPSGGRRRRTGPPPCPGSASARSAAAGGRADGKRRAKAAALAGLGNASTPVV